MKMLDERKRETASERSVHPQRENRCARGGRVWRRASHRPVLLGEPVYARLLLLGGGDGRHVFSRLAKSTLPTELHIIAKTCTLGSRLVSCHSGPLIALSMSRAAGLLLSARWDDKMLRLLLHSFS